VNRQHDAPGGGDADQGDEDGGENVTDDSSSHAHHADGPQHDHRQAESS
jgi:hypothetical protein